MSVSGYHGKPEEEMFLNAPNGGDSPTIVEPLRINKRGSAASPTPSNSSLRGTSSNQPVPSGTAYPMPSLPYPDDRARQQAQAARQNGSPAPYPYPDVRRVHSPEQRTTSAGSMNPKVRAGSTSSTDRPAVLRPGDAKSQSTLAERRGTAPKPLPESPGPEAPDKDGLFQRVPIRGPASAPLNNPNRSQGQQQYWPPPTASSAADSFSRLNIRDPSGVSRISSTASTSTTRAQRGSPPPPETPIVEPGRRPTTDIEARYAASGIAGTGTLTSLQAQSAAAQQRAAAYGNAAPQQQSQQPPRRPWTPTEQPGSAQPAPIVYQGPGAASSSPPAQGSAALGQPVQTPTSRIPPNALEKDVSGLQTHDEPPPAYSQVPGASANYPGEKQRRSTGGAGLAAAAAAATASATATAPVAVGPAHAQPPNQQDHPAFANDPRQPQTNGFPTMNGPMSPTHQTVHQQQAQHPALSQIPPASPPPLPEGWISHMDPNSGQYYYIHLPTQSTQWEFPKGPTPLNLNDTPLSPVGSVFSTALASPGLSFSGKPLASPGLPLTPGYDSQSVMSMSMSMSQHQSAFTGPPPSSGVDLYKVNPTNGVYFGPYLRYTNMDLERGMWLGSILLVTDAPQPPTIHIHQSTDLSPNPRQLKALNIATHQRWTFYKYEIDVQMDTDGPAKWTYAITSHLGCTRYEFLVAGRYETNWRFVATSGNDFTLNVSSNERARLGNVPFMWKDIMQKHAECGGFHCQLGLGGQIFGDRIWKELSSLKQWLAMSGKENRKTAVWTAAHEEDVTHAYFHYYTSHFDQPHLREAFAQIPHILTIDDHDM